MAWASIINCSAVEGGGLFVLSGQFGKLDAECTLLATDSVRSTGLNAREG